MRITLDLNEALLAPAKAAAARERTTVTRLMEEALVLRLEVTRRPPPHRKPPPLPVFQDGTGLGPDLDPLRNHSLLDAADETDQAQVRLPDT